MSRWLKWLLMLAAGFLLILGGVYVYIFYLGGLERYVLKEINGALAAPGNLRVRLDRISGDFYNGVRVDGLAIDYKDSAQSFTLASVAHVSAQYAISDIWKGTLRFQSIDLSGVELTVTRGVDGNWLIPIPATTQGREATAASFSIDRFQIDSAQIRVLRTRDTLALTDFNLTAAIEKDGPSLSVNILRLNFRSSDSTISLDDLAGRATLSGSNLLFQDLLIHRGPTRLRASGNFDVKTMSGDVDVAADGLVLGDVSKLLGGKFKGQIDANGKVSFVGAKINGRMNIGGTFLFADLGNLVVDFRYADKVLDLDTVYGTIFGNCGIDGVGEVNFRPSPEEYQLSADIRNLDLNQIVPKSFPSDLTGRIDLRGRSFSNATLVLAIDVDLYESSFETYPLQRAKGPLLITTDSISFPTTFSVDYYENRFDAVGSIDYNGPMRLEVDADLANLDRYRGRLFIDQPGGRGRAHATLSGRTADPDLTGRFWSDSLWVYGLYSDSAYAEFDIKRFLTARKGTVTVKLGSGDAWTVPFDSGYTHLSLDSLLVRIDTVSFINEYARMNGKGALDQTRYPWRLTVDTLDLGVLDRQYYNRSQMVIDIDTLGFDFVSAVIAEDKTSLSVNRRVNFDESMDVKVGASGIFLAPWLLLLGKDYDLDATLSAEAELGGTFQRPTVDLTGSLDSIEFRGVNLGRLTGSARYRDSLVTIDSVVMLSDNGRYRAEGQLYADLAFTRGVEKRLLDMPFDLKITVSDADTAFKLVPLLLPSVEHVAGDLHADMHLDGTPSRPHLDGHAYLKNGRLKYLELAEVLHTDSASVMMQDNKIVLNNISAYVEDKKTRNRSVASLSGDLTVNAIDSLTYDVRVAIPKAFPVTYDLDDISGVIMDTLYVKGATPPTVSGKLTLVEGRYQVEFAEEQTGSPLMMALSGENTWDLNINIDIPANYWIKNQDIDAEFAGFLNIVREKGLYRFLGELEILRGKGYLFDKTFRISTDSATVTFGDIELFNPSLDIWATSRIPLARTTTEEKRYEDLKVHVTGTLDNPEFAFFLSGQEDTPVGYDAIVPLIVANYYGDASTSGAFEERLSQLVSSQVSQIGTRKLGVETFEIDPTYEGYLNLAQTRVTVGKYAGSNLYLWGRSSVEFQQLPAAGFEYRVSRNLMFEGYRDDDPIQGETYRLNLRMHWEFR